jgi:hypothetical protein
LPGWQVPFGGGAVGETDWAGSPRDAAGVTPWPPLWAPALLEAAGAPPLPPPIAMAEMADPNRTIAQTPIAAETLK